MKIAVLVGSLRRESFTRKVALELMALAPRNLQLGMVEIGRMPLYNQDYDDEENPPATWSEFRNQLREFEGVLFLTPEYNRSLPAVLKNALDVGSRPYGQSVWKGLPAGVVSVSPGALGGFGANHHLRQALVFLDMPVLQQPEAYIGHADKLDDSTRELLKKFMDGYSQWVTQLRLSSASRAA